MRSVLEANMSKKLKALLLIFAMPLTAWAQQTLNRPQVPERAVPPQFGLPGNNRVLPMLASSYVSEIDVTTYGAKGDGRTDDTSAIQNALAAACSPPGLA